MVIDEALPLVNPQQSRLIELRFAHLNLEEAAVVMGVSPSTLKRRWRLAKAWLSRELSTAKSG
jgi:DNA-directed RNA polymerase specialized sigma24 family protein